MIDIQTHTVRAPLAHAHALRAEIAIVLAHLHSVVDHLLDVVRHPAVA